MGTVIQMYASAVPADNMASIDVPSDGKLTGVTWAAHPAAAGADYAQAFQLSFGSTGQLSTNDARAPISTISIAGDITTSGFGAIQINQHDPMTPGLSVQQGERLFLHGSGTAIATAVRCMLHFDFELGRQRARLGR